MKKVKKQRKLGKKREENLENYIDSDGNFYFIAGYTSGGVPYGITWEEAIEDGLIEKDSLSDEEDEIPF
ncbi:hypothetical protein SAMN05660297_03488 [Natronincola peptidivorans]|uniref:Uncharacterized protein n=1 Tax=Natronincola peptidivorans TaxID=426128 RepID=A0A1I0H644_9FIRM|nr:hypothetical protein [Natronincola peptidivorans]SET78217.1 hypothetical protein SAMN05660297_03488 [Natronincola peptidivorans]